MLKYVDTKVCFQEVPNEISLCIDISGCPHKCVGCHSSYLQDDIGTPITTQILDDLVKSNGGITCVCFMGGDNDLPQLHTFAKYIREKYHLKTAWYTGSTLSLQTDRIICQVFDFIKTGPYIEDCGPLNNPKTNQRFYARGREIHKMDANPNMWYDITDRFWNRDKNI